MDFEMPEIDLSGLDQLKDIDWSLDLDDEEGIEYLNSDEFKQEMSNVREEIDRAMKEVRVEIR